MAVAWWLAHLKASGEHKVGDGRHPETYGFPLQPLLVERETLVAAGVPRDGIPALQEPGAVSLAQLPSLGRRFLLPSDPVVGVRIQGQARAYPLRVLVFHELVNDTLGGEPILVVHQPLCGLTAVFSRRVAGQVLAFANSGLLWNSCGLMYQKDQPLRGLWSPLLGKAVAGPATAEGLQLSLLPFALTSWQRWQHAHPQTTVVAPDRHQLSQYKRDPYSSYLGSELLRFPVRPPLPESSPWRPKAPLAVLWPYQDPLPLPLEALQGKARTFRTRGQLLELVPIGRSGWAELRSLADPPPPWLYVFAFAWYAAHPQPGPGHWQLPSP